MKSSKNLGAPKKPSIMSSLVMDGKKKTTLVPSDKRVTKILVISFHLIFESNVIAKKTTKKPCRRKKHSWSGLKWWGTWWIKWTSIDFPSLKNKRNHYFSLELEPKQTQRPIEINRKRA